MLRIVKAKIQKYISLLSGRFRHLKKGITISKKWYGNNYGGFYVSPKFINEHSIIYSFGIGEDISFDEALIKEYKCTIFGFDPTPKSIKWIKERVQVTPSRFNFYEYGIANESGTVDFFLPKNTDHVSGSFVTQNNVSARQIIKVEMKSLVDIVKLLGHKRIDVLKMDIEGAEYQVLEGILKTPVEISQVLVEFHDRFFKDGRSKTINAIELLNAHGYEIFGVSDSLEEVSFIKKSVISKEKA